MKKKIIILSVLLVLIMSISELPALANTENKIKIALMISNRANKFFGVLENSFLDTAKELGYDVEVFDAFNDATKQPLQIKDAIAKNIKAIVLNPLNADIPTSAVNEAIEKGIPVMTIDSAIKGAKLLAEIATDNINGGQTAAEWLVTKSEIAADKLSGIIHIKGIEGHTSHIDRYNGFNNFLKSTAAGKEWNDLAIDSKRYIELSGDFTIDITRAALESKLTDLDINGKYVIYCENDLIAIGAIQALENNNDFNLQNFTVIGFDGSPDGIKLVDNGKMAITIVQDFVFLGKKAVLILDDYFKNKIKPKNPIIAVPVQMYQSKQKPLEK